MIKRTNRKIAAHVYWIAITFVFLALIALALLPHASGQAGANNARRSATHLPYSPATSSQTATAQGARSVPILIPPNFPRKILYNHYSNRGTSATSSQDFEAEFDVFSDELAN